MAKNVKVKKKKASYDTKLIAIIAISVSVVIIGVLCAALLVDYFGNAVGFVDGRRILKYEYKIALTDMKNEMQEDAVAAGTLDESADENALEDFWTDERKAELKKKAAEKVRVWEAEYLLAKKAGKTLTYKERNTYKENLEYQIYYTWNQSYQNYYTYDEYLNMYLGGMTMEQYTDYMIKTAAIEQYKEELKKAYSATDDELKAVYDKAPDDYRKVTLRVFAKQKPAAVEEPKAPDVPQGKDGTILTEATAVGEYATAWEEYKTLLSTYEENKKSYEEYKTNLSNTETRMKEIFDSLSKDGTYTGTPDVTSEEETSEAPETYDKANLAKIAATEGGLFKDAEGIVAINAKTSSGYDVLDEYALTMQWKDASRNSIISVSKDADGKEVKNDDGGEKSEDGKITYTKYVALEDDSFFYILRCEGIEDFENSVESSEGAADDVKSVIKSEIFTDKAEDELEKMVADAGKKYTFKSQKDEKMEAILKEAFSA